MENENWTVFERAVMGLFHVQMEQIVGEKLNVEFRRTGVSKEVPQQTKRESACTTLRAYPEITEPLKNKQFERSRGIGE